MLGILVEPKKTDNCYCVYTINMYGFFTEKIAPSEGTNYSLTPHS